MFRSIFFAAITIVTLTLLAASAAANGNIAQPTFRVQTDMLALTFAGRDAASLVFAGRDERGAPMLGLLSRDQGALDYTEIALPAGAAAIDVGPASAESDALFILAAGAVYRLDGALSDLIEVAKVSSVYRGRSFAELISNVDFARDIDGDDVAELLVPDFDALHVIVADARRDIGLASLRRGYEQTIAYRPARVAVAPAAAPGALFTVRGDTLFSFPPNAASANTRALNLGLSSELEQEVFYNGYEDVDQNDIVVREVDRFEDINNDGLPDIVTLETVSAGVFDKTTTYRIHHGRLDGAELRFDNAADTTLSSRGYQLGARPAPLDDARQLIVTASVQVGIRTIIGALFSRAVTMRIEIYPPTEAGTIASSPSTTVKARVKFDFGTGQVEFPTIAFGDIDGDGSNDLIVKERKRALNWRRGLGDGSFASRVEDLGVTGPADGTDVVLADLDGDSRDEVIVRYGRADGVELSGRIAVFGDFQTAR